MRLRVTSRNSYPTVVGQVLNRMCIQNEQNRNLQFKRRVRQSFHSDESPSEITYLRPDGTTYLGTPKIRNL